MSIRSCIKSAVILSVITAGFAALGWPSNFEVFKRGHFIIYHNNRTMANKLSWKAEYHYKRIINHFSVRSFQPWGGDDRCLIYLYKTRGDYMSATGAPDWSQGIAEFKTLRFSSFEGADNLLTTTLPHEMTHLLLHLFMEGKPVPIWLNEGMAQLEEEDKATVYQKKRFLKSQVREGAYIPLSQLIYMNRVPEDKVQLFYTESASVVDHLINDNIRANFGRFLTYIKNGDPVESALKKSYQWKYKNGISDLEKRWLEYVKRKY